MRDLNGKPISRHDPENPWPRVIARLLDKAPLRPPHRQPERGWDALPRAQLEEMGMSIRYGSPNGPLT